MFTTLLKSTHSETLDTTRYGCIAPGIRKCLTSFFQLHISVKILTGFFANLKNKKKEKYFLEYCILIVTVIWGLCIFNQMWDLREAAEIIFDINNLITKQIFVYIVYSLHAHKHLIEFRSCPSKHNGHWLMCGLWVILSEFDLLWELKTMPSFISFLGITQASGEAFLFLNFFWMSNTTFCW